MFRGAWFSCKMCGWILSSNETSGFSFLLSLQGFTAIPSTLVVHLPQMTWQWHFKILPGEPVTLFIKKLNIFVLRKEHLFIAWLGYLDEKRQSYLWILSPLCTFTSWVIRYKKSIEKTQINDSTFILQVFRKPLLSPAQMFCSAFLDRPYNILWRQEKAVILP